MLGVSFRGAGTMLTLIYTLAFTQVLTVIGILILGVWTTVLQRKIKRLKRDEQISNAIRKYELEWGE